MDVFKPSFKCKHCGNVVSSYVNGDQGLLVPCDCEESRKQREFEHRMEMERRKRARRGR